MFPEGHRRLIVRLSAYFMRLRLLAPRTCPPRILPRALRSPYERWQRANVKNANFNAVPKKMRQEGKLAHLHVISTSHCVRVDTSKCRSPGRGTIVSKSIDIRHSAMFDSPVQRRAIDR